MWWKAALIALGLLANFAACGDARRRPAPARSDGGASGGGNSIDGGDADDAGQAGTTANAGAAGTTGGTGSTVGAGGVAGSTGVGGESGAGEGGGASCNEIDNSADTIEAVRVGLDPLLPSGGVIVDGTYHLSSRIIYSGAGGPTGGRTELVQATMIINGDQIESVGGEVSAMSERRSARYEVNGTDLTFDVSCPVGVANEVRPFTATIAQLATVITIYHPEGAETRAETWTKQ